MDIQSKASLLRPAEYDARFLDFVSSVHCSAAAFHLNTTANLLMTQPKSDVPLMAEVLRFFDTLFEPRPRTEPQHAVPKPTQPATAAAPLPAAFSTAYTLAPLAQLSGSSSADPIDLRYDLGLAILRRTSLQDSTNPQSSSSSNSSSTISIALPSVMSLAPPSPQRSRKQLSDSGAGKPQWLQQLPRLSAEHHRVFQSVQKLTLKVGQQSSIPAALRLTHSVRSAWLAPQHAAFGEILALWFHLPSTAMACSRSWLWMLVSLGL